MLPLLASGLLTPHEGRRFIELVSTNLTSDIVEIVHKAFRSMTVTLLSTDTPSHRLEEWAYVLKALVSETSRTFPGSSERFISLRCMLLETSEIRDLKDSEHAERPGVIEVVRLLESESRPMSLSEISSKLGIDRHSAASRTRIGIAIGRLKADYEAWETMLVSSEPVA